MTITWQAECTDCSTSDEGDSKFSQLRYVITHVGHKFKFVWREGKK